MTIHQKPTGEILTGFGAAKRYIELLTGNASSPVCFRTFDDDQKRRDKSLARKIDGSLSLVWQQLSEASERGCGLFFVVNAGGQSGKSITRVRAVFIDGDEIPLPTTWHAPPHFLTVRDETHWHAFWIVSDGFPLEEFTTTQERLIAHYGSDEKVKDLPHVMRLPGSMHKKTPASPVPVTLHDLSAGKTYTDLHRYSLAEVTSGLPDVKRKAQAERKAGPSGEVDTPLAIAKARAVFAGAPPAIQGDHGDNSTYALFARVLDCGVSEEMAFEIATEEDGWNSRCLPTWHDDELKTKIKNAKKHRQNEGVVIGRGDLMTMSTLQSAAYPGSPSPNAGLPVLSGDNGDLQFARGEKGSILKTFKNARIAALLTRAKPELDLFTGEVVFRNEIVWDERHGRELNETVSRAIRAYWSDAFGIEPAHKDVDEAVLWVADQHTFNSLQEHVMAVAWDGVERLDTWLITYMGADDTLLNRAIGRKFIIGMVRRAFEPGCKHDEMLVFEGKQGAGKSSVAKLLAGPSRFFYEPSIKDLENKDAMISTRGRWLGEFAEMSGIVKADVDAIKKFLACQVDDYRAVYGRRNSRFPRVPLFVGTVNSSGYLMDQTGNRRFWPVRTGRIDELAFARDRDQIIAEAAFLYHNVAEDNRLPPELWGDAAAATEARLVVNPWEELLRRYLDHGPHVADSEEPKPIDRAFARTLLSDALKLSVREQTPGASKALKQIMTERLGWHYRESLKIGSLPVSSGYVRPKSGE